MTTGASVRSPRWMRRVTQQRPTAPGGWGLATRSRQGRPQASGRPSPESRERISPRSHGETGRRDLNCSTTERDCPRITRIDAKMIFTREARAVPRLWPGKRRNKEKGLELFNHGWTRINTDYLQEDAEGTEAERRRTGLIQISFNRRTQRDATRRKG